MNTYQIIKNESLLREFIDRILPDTEPDECFYIGLLARDKWIRGSGAKISSQIQLKRFKDFEKTWYNAIARQQELKTTFTMNGDNLLPVPGCVQGDFVPYCLTS